MIASVRYPSLSFYFHQIVQLLYFESCSEPLARSARDARPTRYKTASGSSIWRANSKTYAASKKFAAVVSLLTCNSFGDLSSFFKTRIIKRNGWSSLTLRKSILKFGIDYLFRFPTTKLSWKFIKRIKKQVRLTRENVKTSLCSPHSKCQKT